MGGSKAQGSSPRKEGFSKRKNLRSASMVASFCLISNIFWGYPQNPGDPEVNLHLPLLGKGTDDPTCICHFMASSSNHTIFWIMFASKKWPLYRYLENIVELYLSFNWFRLIKITHMFFDLITYPKTNITMEHEPSEDVFPT